MTQVAAVGVKFFSKQEVELMEEVIRRYLQDFVGTFEQKERVYNLYGRFIHARHEFDTPPRKGVIL